MRHCRSPPNRPIMASLSLRLVASLLPLAISVSSLSPTWHNWHWPHRPRPPHDHAAHPSHFCRQIDRQFPGLVHYPGTAGYLDSQSDYYTAEERELDPGCVFRPRDTSDVSRFVKLVASRKRHGPRHGRHRPEQYEFSFRCGGHSFFAEAANMDGGVTIDLRSLNSFKLSADKKTVSIGGGSIWSETVSEPRPPQSYRPRRPNHWGWGWRLPNRR